MKMMLLFGSGISLKAGMPDCDDIHQALRNGHTFGLKDERNKKYTQKYVVIEYGPGYHLHEDKDLYNYSPQDKDKLEVVKKLYPYIEKKLMFKEYNYEDIIDVMIELVNYYRKTYNKRIYENFYFELMKEFELDKKKLCDVIEESIRYCQFVVAEMLNREWDDKELKYLDIIKDIKELYGNTDIFTLNHDMILENYFKNLKIEFNSGFEKRNGGVFEFDINNYKNEKEFNLYKLHGSIEWRFKREGNRSIFWIRSNEETDFNDLIYQPFIAVGSYNKYEMYQQHIFSDLNYKFKEKCYEADYILISGYGFHDEGINYS